MQITALPAVQQVVIRILVQRRTRLYIQIIVIGCVLRRAQLI